MLSLFAFFHLNLAFSAIEAEARAEVIARCYWPLLRMAERIGAIGIEATGFTLEEIETRDADWIAELKRLIAAGKVAFIGSGYSQIVGPLVPAKVTEANLAIGNRIYRRLLGFVPEIALVGEQAYSGGLVGLYAGAGYHAILMDWNNPATFHDWPDETRYRPQRAGGSDGTDIGLIWTDTVAFQMLQRLAHADIALSDYLDFVRGLKAAQDRLVCLYASDAEVFDYRPGRYRTEEVFDGEAGSEWDRLEAAFCALDHEPDCRRVLLTPQSVRLPSGGRHLTLESPECPVPVKKQRKYNLSRWAVTGRDDLGLNAACERIYRGLAAHGGAEVDWKELCFLWSSDFRTHITESRWAAMRPRLAAMETRFSAPLPPPPHAHGEPVADRFLDIRTPFVSARLDRRRGLALDAVSFAGSPPLIGKLPLGVFEDIGLLADWYTGDCVFEAPGEHKITDLEWGEAALANEAEDILVFGRIETSTGPIEKCLRFSGTEPAIDFDLAFDWPDWGKGSLRLGHVTLLPASWNESKLTLTTHNGGKTPEVFALAGHKVEHGAPVSFLVSASQGVGMTEGWAELSDGAHFVRIAVDRTVAPLMGLLTHRRVRGGLFCQFLLSALELDDTRRPDSLALGPRAFRFRLSGGPISATC
jgi:hypothetical protein